ncbi:hypothetical protein HA461_20425 [Rhizobium leguminosarum bv. trifolii]|uniref:hypothetical protein n=1 Tax=Rhizobium leguminosarum TaxID=384 RepID=UPI00140FDFB0|nr:hypothetical protein [Rhizobium leguminosarum]QIO53390.1 hypothetical protein HA461_20425 [Rhizobium leguminosarum bv. trifolii]
MSDWIPAISSSGVMALICFIWGTYYKAAIERGVQHRLDIKLEEMRSSFRQDEERHKQALKTQDERISALRSGALSSLASRSAALDKRRLEAVETLWAAVSDYGPLKMACKMTEKLNMEKMIEAAELGRSGSENLRKFADFIWTTCKLDDYRSSGQNIAREKPFVSPLAWAIYSAHSISVSSPVLELGAVRTGVGPKILKDPKALLDSIKAVLPGYTDFINELGSAAMPHLIEPLENALLDELRKHLDGAETDEQTLTKAAAIIKAADSM